MIWLIIIAILLPHVAFMLMIWWWPPIDTSTLWERPHYFNPTKEDDNGPAGMF